MKYLFTTIACCLFQLSFGQLMEGNTVKQLFDESLSHGKSYEYLRQLSKDIGQRLSGSEGAARAVQWGQQTMKDAGFDSVWLQPVMVPRWVRGQKETAFITGSKNKDKTNIIVCALGGSVGTGPGGVKGNVIEVTSLKELSQIKNVKGKIIFFNRPMDPTNINTFAAYGGAVDQRAYGPSVAASFGAVAVIVRSMGINPENYPHTGAMVYAPDTTKIPAFAVSTVDAEVLSGKLKTDKGLQLYLESHCETLDDIQSYNVVGQIKGSEFPAEIIAVGGHLDSWDLAEGAHDDGAGCVHSIEALRLLNGIGYKPKRTIRAILFMNEENGTKGAAKYAELAATNHEKHLAAIESDRGGFTPRGFTLSGNENTKAIIRNWKPLLEPYGLTDFSQAGAGADIGPLAKQGVFLIGFLPDSQRYFDYHHTPEDTFEKVSKRELELGCASISALIFLIDANGLSGK